MAITNVKHPAPAHTRTEMARLRRQRRTRAAVIITVLALVLGVGGTLVARSFLHLQGQLTTTRTQLHNTRGELTLAQGRADCAVPTASVLPNGMGEMVSPVWSHPSTGAIDDAPIMTPTSYSFNVSPLAVQKVLRAVYALRESNGTCSIHDMTVRLGPDRFSLGNGRSIRMLQAVANFPAGHPPVWVSVVFQTVPEDAPAPGTSIGTVA